MFVKVKCHEMVKRLFSIIILAVGFIFFTAQDTDAEKGGLKRKIEMALLRLDMRLEKVDKGVKNTTDQKAIESVSEFRGKLEKSKAALQSDLKELSIVKKEDWKKFKEGVDSHLDNAKESSKPVVL